MPTLTAVLGDLTTQDVDVVVNAANRALRGGGGVDGAIHRAGGPAILRDCVARFPEGLPTGRAGATTAGDLRARWVVHAVGPNWNAGERDAALLASCYERALTIASDLGARTVAFPLISAGTYGWPRSEAISVAVETILGSPFAVEHVRLVAVDPDVHAAIRGRIPASTQVRILQGVRVLHRRGYETVRIRPGMSGSGMHWRVSITAADDVLRYSTGGDTAFADGRVTPETSPDTVADLILGALPAAAPAGDPLYVTWFDKLLRLVEQTGQLPIAYADYFRDETGWEVGWGSGVRFPRPPELETRSIANM